MDQRKQEETRIFANGCCQTNNERSRVAVGQDSMSDATDDDMEHLQERNEAHQKRQTAAISNNRKRPQPSNIEKEHLMSAAREIALAKNLAYELQWIERPARCKTSPSFLTQLFLR